MYSIDDWYKYKPKSFYISVVKEQNYILFSILP